MKNLAKWLCDENQAQRANAFKVTLTPEMAALFLQEQAQNRPVRSARVKKLQSLIRDDKWRFNGQGLVFNAAGQMVNGQHTCTAVIAENKAVVTLIVLDVDQDAWLSLDNIGMRSAADHLHGEENRTCLAAAINWVWQERNGFLRSRQATIPTGDAPAMVEEFPSLRDAVSIASRLRYVLPPGLCAYLHFRMSLIHQEKAKAFFYSLETGENLEVGNPVLLLRERLLKEKKLKTELPQVEMLALAIKAWTPFMHGRKIANLRWRGEVEEFPAWSAPLPTHTALRAVK